MSGQIKKARRPKSLGPSAKNTELFYNGLVRGAIKNGKIKNTIHSPPDERIYMDVLPRYRLPGIQKGTTKEAKEHPNG